MILLCSLLLLGVFSQPPIPVERLTDGLSMGDPGKAIIQFEHVIDPCCPDCQDFYLRIMPEIYSYYFDNITRGFSKPNDPSGLGDLFIKVHMLALPYHISSFLMTKSTIVIQKSTDPKVDWFDWITYVYKNQNLYENDKVKDLGQEEIIELIYNSFFEKYGFNKDNFTKKMTTDMELEGLTRAKWKFSTFRGCYGTPTFFVNGVTVPAKDNFEDWKELFDSLKKQINQY